MPDVIIVDCHRSFQEIWREGKYDGSVTENVSTSNHDTYWQNARVGSSRPGWRKIVASGGDATNELHGSKMTLSIRPMFIESESFGGWYTRITGHPTWGVDCGMMDPPQYLYDEAQSIAETQMVDAVREQRTKWEAGEFLGELGQTVRFMLNPLKSIKGQTIKAARTVAETAARLRRYDRASDILQRSTDTWLAYKFGLEPAIKDLAGASKAVQAAIKGHQRYETIRLIGSGKAEEGLSSLGGFNRNGFASPSVVTSITEKRTASVRILGGYSVGLDRSPEMGFLDQFGLAPDNWVPTAYELFPWSHVVDYFTNVGDVLDAFSLGAVNFRWLNQTSRFERTLTKVIESTTPAVAGGVIIAYGGQVDLKQTNVSRTGRSNVFSPRFLVKKPSLVQSLNIAAMANTIKALKATAGN